MKRPELLAPAGNPEKLRAAIRYGADAVYLSGECFGMRAGAGNFSHEQLGEAIAYAHAHGVRVYLTVNTMPREYEYTRLREYLSSLAALPPDALIIGDIGVFMLARELLPEVELHVSTQANAVSAADCLAWYRLGARRVVLARELSMAEIRAIRAAIPADLELECFIHGSMCISYSGRCLLSGHIVGRDANRGMCAQPCRWQYTLHADIVEQKRPELLIPIEETGGETFIMASRDTCMIEHVPELVEAGIHSFKIEGRMKSAYYTAVVTNAYRMALDSYFSGEYRYDPRWYRELESVSHREYATGYYFSDSHTDPNTASSGGYLAEKAYLAVALSYDAATGYATFEQRNKLSLGDRVELLTPGQVGEAMTVEALTDGVGTPLISAPHPSMHFRMPVPHPIRAGDILRAGC